MAPTSALCSSPFSSLTIYVYSPTFLYDNGPPSGVTQSSLASGILNGSPPSFSNLLYSAVISLPRSIAIALLGSSFALASSAILSNFRICAITFSLSLGTLSSFTTSSSIDSLHPQELHAINLCFFPPHSGHVPSSNISDLNSAINVSKISFSSNEYSNGLSPCDG